ncbi:hypothetical protein EW026_g8150 [Hermanssonia centrifuga]|uniref:Major facilitator superfamily (MFS) profile domain-containing protein n=1 Tax=Hermanssonia centrifuga TaxID=98765 RepID=A0A4S4K5C6_9APHY|nr:hypothetical protein EW026_g8150 [Hermanssonia centrifuga]
MKVTRPEQLSLPIPSNSPQPPVYSAPDLKPATRRASLVKAGNSRASDLGPSSSRTPAVPESDELFDPASSAAAAGYHDYRSGHVRRVEGSSMGGYASTLNYPGLSPQALPSSLPPLSRNGRIPEDRYEYPPEKATLTMTAEIELMSPSFDPYGAGDPGTHLSRQRRAALEEVDNANFSYDIFSINIASTMLAYVYTGGKWLDFRSAEGEPDSRNSAIKAATPVGTFLGQLLFGWLADVVGRKRMYGVELIIIIIGTFGQALASDDTLGTVNIVAALVIWRFIMGIGVGGDYPLSAVISSEFASTHIRGRMLTAVFANQGWGQFAASIAGLVSIAIFKGSIKDFSIGSTDHEVLKAVDRAWRLLIGLGCVPAAIALYFRLTIPETPRFTMDVERNLKQAMQDIDRFLSSGTYKYDPDSIVVRVDAPRASKRNFFEYFSKWDNLKILLGCAYAWFAVDVTFYGLGLNTDKFFNAIGFAPPPSASDGDLFPTAKEVFTYFSNLCTANMLLSVAGFIPGYWITFYFVDKWGRRPIQLMGFAVLTVLFLVVGFVFQDFLESHPPMVESIFKIEKKAVGFVVLFCLISLFQNFGPNSTTFIVPGEVFPTRYRSTGHGITAASGKVGAIVSQFGFANVRPATAYVGLTESLEILLISEMNFFLFCGGGQLEGLCALCLYWPSFDTPHP